MRVQGLGWLRWAAELDGPRFHEFQVGLTRYNEARLQPLLPEDAAANELAREQAFARAEVEFVEAQRKTLARWDGDVPRKTDAFIAWFERLKASGPGQGDRRFPWLAEHATLEQMKWFLLQEVAGEAGFEDLLAMT